jgi:hypothetical protein
MAGPADTAEGAHEWLSAWEDFRFDAEEYRELDDERVLVLTRFSGRGEDKWTRARSDPGEGGRGFSTSAKTA